MAERGAVTHAMSGAGRIKHDGHTDDFLFECKDAPSRYTITAKEMKELFVRACRQNKVGVFLIYFADAGFTVECKLIPGGKEAV